MQHFGAEVSQLRSFFEADNFYASRIPTDSGIGGNHAIHIGPDLDAVSVQAGTNNGGRKIGATASDRGSDSLLSGADESADNRHQTFVHQRFHLGPEAVIGFVHLGNGTSMVGVGDDALARVHQLGIYSAGRKRRIDNCAGEPLAKGHDVIGGAWREFADGSNTAQQFVERIAIAFQYAMKLRK